MTANKKWIILENNKDKISRICKKFNISPIIASVILNRGFKSDEEISDYLSKDESLYYDPFLLSDMANAVDYIKKSIDQKIKIAVYGDYDVDGITSTYILYDYLKSAGADVCYYIPDRADEGYGVNTDAIDKLKSDGVKLIITVDVGITAVDEVNYAKKCGVDFIITDHHTPKEILPDALAVIDPKIDGNLYPNKELAGVGVAYKLVYALSGCSKDIMKMYSVAASIGTIADMVPLKNENRFIASYGLSNLKDNTNAGLNALMEVAGVDKTQLTSSSISYSLAPRLNAAGRIASAVSSVELFLEEDEKKALAIAMCLDEDNKTRQSEEALILAEAEEIILRDKLANDDVIVVAKKGWHHGVIGIVSSKITEKYYKPSAVISINEDGSAKASGRSIAGFNLFDALSACKEHLSKFGGHDLAAGFSLEEGKIADFRKAVNEYAKDIMTDDIRTPKLIIDAVISPEDISCSTAAEIELLEPFGIGNKAPVFCVNDASVTNIRSHKSGKHSFLTLEKHRTRFEVPAFNMAALTADITHGDKISVAGVVNINTFRGIDTVQFIAKDIKSTGCTKLNDDVLRNVFVCLKEYVTRNIFSFIFSDIKQKLINRNIFLGISELKICFKIFKELDLIDYEIHDKTVIIKRGRNFYSKCQLSKSATYVKEITQAKE